jgi:lipoprotein-anchoring transpeptidase ErfK/SrfK
MSLPKLFLAVSVSLFVLIGVLSVVKQSHRNNSVESTEPVIRQDVDLTLLARSHEIQQSPVGPIQTDLPSPTAPTPQSLPVEERPVVIEHDAEPESLSALFVKNSSCPIVETIVYKSHVPWKRNRQAWLIDYANYYKTPLDFLYRCLNNKADYTPRDVAEGVQFNVYRRNLDFRFHAIVSLSSCRLRLYYVIPGERRVVFLKSYQVCVGRKDASRASGFLTPLGTYQLGSRVAVFRPRMMGMHKNKKVEMIQVFGTHWIPFEREISGCTEPAKGFGIHGTPIHHNEQTGQLEEDTSSIGQSESDGCIRVANKDMHELFSIVSTRTTYVEIVPSFQQSKVLRGEI